MHQIFVKNALKPFEVMKKVEKGSFTFYPFGRKSKKVVLL